MQSSAFFSKKLHETVELTNGVLVLRRRVSEVLSRLLVLITVDPKTFKLLFKISKDPILIKSLNEKNLEKLRKNNFITGDAIIDDLQQIVLCAIVPNKLDEELLDLVDPVQHSNVVVQLRKR